MTEWSIEFEIRGIEPPNDDAVDDLVERLHDYAAVVAVFPDGYSVRMSTIADAPEAALASARSAVAAATRSVGVPIEPVVRAEVSAEDNLDAELRQPIMPTLVGVAEIAQRLGVSRQRVSELAGTDQFPEPIARLAAGPIWAEPTLLRFVEQWERRPGRKPVRAA